MASNSSYGRYAGGPDPLAPPVDLADALAAIGEDVMAGYSPEQAMREYLRRGSERQRGLDELRQQVAQRREEILARHNLNGTLQQVKELLDKAVLEERKRLARDLDDDARFGEMRMENLPSSPAQAVTELADYQWRSADAREHYEQIKDLLGREMLDQRFAGMKQALQSATDEDRAAVAAMLRDLNELLAKRAAGEDTDQDFADFMAKHGEYFPENPQNLDELLDAMAARAAAAQRMLNSMSPEQREELMELAQQAFGSPDLMDQLSQLDSNLQALRPGEDWGGSQEGFEGQDGLGLGDGTGALQDLADLDSIAEQLDQDRPGASMDDLDLDSLAQQLGPEAAVDARTLAQLERELRDSGYLTKGSDGALRLSPRAMRQLGKTLLRDVADRMSGRSGDRDMRRAGAAGELTGSTRQWEFGDTQSWDVNRTITNAVRRTVADGASARGGVRIEINDIEVSETEARTQAAVVLLVDTSYSMIRAGRWVPMKRTALALHQLISTRFRGDHLQLVGFGRHAEVMGIEELTGLSGMQFKGTNLHHGLLLANRFFRKQPNAQPVLLIVTDGEPTAHLERDGHSFFDYPPHPYTIAATVRELDTAGRIGAQTTFFQLGDDPGLGRFLGELARRVDGRVVTPDLDDLGSAVVGSFLGSRADLPHDLAGEYGFGRGWWA
ncbi:VWA domain-containing protein [Yimella sp. cx-51]|uniref:vWA domain-containing protein n=1 Tax=Yimella sp. cx-51 TaxID=2770551 RepID=UPI00165DCE4F|nr:VWA domain-containing protein [Yimella sp. cx-51]MBC9955665.1 VWA domain-containing protein [Yimella sp. cx-51]QTH37764.1 VWA domain-containing protein [Yimella sp. cx-51]